MTDIQAILSKKGEKTSGLIKSQLEGYEFILDLATGKREFTEAWIRELHQVLCKSQETYSVHTPQGPMEQALPLGEYKKLPNHVLISDGIVHSYAPVDMVGAEMNRLLKIVKTPNFNQLHPVIQAVYLHYGFVCIHPFSDGNGRVARALASVFLYRSNSIPFLVLSEDRTEYLNSLEAADKGNYNEIIEFTMDRCFNAIDFIDISIKSGSKVDINTSLDKLKSFFKTKGGFSHESVDRAAARLMDEFYNLLTNSFDDLKKTEFFDVVEIRRVNHAYTPISSGHRMFISGNGLSLSIQLTSKKPNQVTMPLQLQIHIPKDCDVNDDFIILNSINSENLNARINEILFNIKPSLKFKLEIFTKSVLDDLVERLVDAIKKLVDKK